MPTTALISLYHMPFIAHGSPIGLHHLMLSIPRLCPPTSSTTVFQCYYKTHSSLNLSLTSYPPSPQDPLRTSLMAAPHADPVRTTDFMTTPPNSTFPGALLQGFNIYQGKHLCVQPACVLTNEYARRHKTCKSRAYDRKWGLKDL